LKQVNVEELEKLHLELEHSLQLGHHSSASTRNSQTHSCNYLTRK